MFRELTLKKSYSSSRDNILGDFYIPVLKEAVLYRRTTAFFNSYSLSRAAEGLAHFYSNGGKCQLISGLQLSPEDFNAIKDGLKDPDQIIVDKFDLNFSETLDKLQHDRLKFLSWLLATERMEIKIAVIADVTHGIYHEKMGIFQDKNGDEISFVGSVNETPAGWTSNVEQFKVFRSWVDEESDYVISDNEQFDDYWSHKNSKVLIFNIPEAINRKLIEIKPTEVEIKKIIKDIQTQEEVEKQDTPKEITVPTIEELINIAKNKTTLPLRPYQEEAVNQWLKGGKRGIFSMATGTGKTLTALGAASRISESGELFLVIAVPYGHLVTQWIDDIEVQLPGVPIIKVYSKNPNWRSQLKEALKNYDDSLVKKYVVIGTYASIASESFLDIVETNKPGGDKELMIIADEMHNFGANDAQRGMLDIYGARLGLSATPQRYFDEEGTDALFDYFGGIVFEFSLQRAIKEKHLTPYRYFPIFVYLNDEEMEQYQEISHKMRKFFDNDAKETNPIFFNLAIKRARILKKAMGKIKALDDILEKISKEAAIKHLLVYCEDTSQLKISQNVMDSHHLVTHRFTGSESLEDRREILNNFDEKSYDALLAIKCLDEGVNVPSTQTAIIMASSGNSREYIQRKGRVLRKSEKTGKTTADIYDMVVLPPDASDKLAKKIVEREFLRIKDFAECAENYADIIDNVFDVMVKYGVYF